MRRHNPALPGSRKSIRLKGYDYAQAGLYFVTICTYRRASLFGQVVQAEMVLNRVGQRVQRVWDELPEHFPELELDAFVVMPNHVHAIFAILAPPALSMPPSSAVSAAGPKPRSVGAVVGSFKSAASRQIRLEGHAPDAPVWQRNYYDHIIRSETALERIRAYIAGNPARWLQDAEKNTDQIHREGLVW